MRALGSEAVDSIDVLIDTVVSGFDDETKGAALRALAAIGLPSVRPLIRALYKPVPISLWDAFSVFATIGPDAKDAVPVLLGSLRLGDNAIRWAATQAISAIGLASIPELMKAATYAKVHNDTQLMNILNDVLIANDDASASTILTLINTSSHEDVDAIRNKVKADKWKDDLKLFYLVGRLHYEEGAMSIYAIAKRLAKRCEVGRPFDGLPYDAVTIGRRLKKLRAFFCRPLQQSRLSIH